jgi:hypothetical protein
MRKSANQLRKLARGRADEEARRIPWQRLFEARNQYIDWSTVGERWKGRLIYEEFELTEVA